MTLGVGKTDGWRRRAVIAYLTALRRKRKAHGAVGLTFNVVVPWGGSWSMTLGVRGTGETRHRAVCPLRGDPLTLPSVEMRAGAIALGAPPGPCVVQGMALSNLTNKGSERLAGPTPLLGATCGAGAGQTAALAAPLHLPPGGNPMRVGIRMWGGLTRWARVNLLGFFRKVRSGDLRPQGLPHRGPRKTKKGMFRSLMQPLRCPWGVKTRLPRGSAMSERDNTAREQRDGRTKQIVAASTHRR